MHGLNKISVSASSSWFSSCVRSITLVQIFLLGILSGLPFLLTLATLHIRLAEAGKPASLIGIFSFVTLPYAAKFLLAPMVDSARIPVLYARLGQRRSWLLMSQFALAVSIAFLGLADPLQSIYRTALAAILVALFSAVQDIVYEAYRIEILSKSEMGTGASCSMMGYRIGFWISGACALYLAEIFSWQTSYLIMAIIVLVGTTITLWLKEPSAHCVHSAREHRITVPLMSLIKNEPWLLVATFIFLYKLGDSTINVMTAPFLLDMGFSKIEIAHVVKSFGMAAMVAGGVLGAYLLTVRPLYWTVLLCSALHVFSCTLFYWQAQCGYDMNVLVVGVAVENLTVGLGTACFITYLSQLCHVPFTATHYALLSSFASLCRVASSSMLGFLAEHLGWQEFYAVMGMVCALGFLLIATCSRHFARGVAEQTVEVRPLLRMGER